MGTTGSSRWLLAPGFFAALSDYLNVERPTDPATTSVFVVLKDPAGADPCPRRGSTKSSAAHAGVPDSER